MKKALTAINFNQKAWWKPYIYMNTELWKKAKYGFKRDFFKLMNNSVFGKTIENVKKNRDMKLVTTKKRRNYFVSEPNYCKMIFFSKFIRHGYQKNTDTHK